MADIDPRRLAEAKARLRATSTDSPGATYCGIPVEAFDREELSLMLSLAMDQFRSEQDANERLGRVLVQCMQR